MWKFFAVVFLIFAVYIGIQFIDNFDPESIKGKNVVITGASTGIGEQIAYHYARLGANIVITARRENKLKEVVEKCGQIGQKDGKYFFIPLDMEHEDSGEKLIKFAESKLSSIDILVLNHAIISFGYYEGTPENITNLNKMMNVNFNSYVATASYALPALKKSKGSILISDSLAGKIPYPVLITYSTATHAMEGFFAGLREEFKMRETGISITFAVFGFVTSDNAMQTMKERGWERLLDYMSPTSPSDAALVLIQGGAQRFERVYAPYLENKIPELLVNVLPGLVTKYIRSISENFV